MRDTIEELEGQLAELKSQISGLVDILVGKGTLTTAQRKILAVPSRANDGRKVIRLAVLTDKYTTEPEEPIDCAAIIPICHGRCCSFAVQLSSQDLDEGQLKWDLENPYLLRKGPDGQCMYQDPVTKFCMTYDNRPAECRRFTCRDDPRIWADFDKKIPLP